MCFRMYALPVILPWLVLSGCAKDDTWPATYKTTGVVTLRSEPVENAVLMFYPISDEGKSAQATTNAAGRFDVHTYVQTGELSRGMVPGDYRVTIAKLDMSKVTSTLTPPQNVLQHKYSDPRTSELNAKVKADAKNHFEFALE